MLACALLAATIAAATPTPTSTSTAPATAQPPAAPPNMESYQLVLLRRGPAWTPEVTPAIEELQRLHLAHFKAMWEAGHLMLAGPFSDQADPALRGACVYRASSAAEARALAERDPMVQAGRLVVEVVTWWVEKGYLSFPKSPPRAP